MWRILVGLWVSASALGQSSDELLRMADQIAAKVAKTRGLRVKQPLKKGVLSREEIGKRLMARLKREYSSEDVRAEERVLKRLGLLPIDIDYEQTVTKLLMEQVAGFYDPFEKELFIADWLDVELQRPALAHEIAHALCDQHFDLRPYGKPIKEEGDRQLARAALVEGDGTAVMIEYTLAEQAEQMGVPIAADIGQLPEAFFSLSNALAATGSMPALEQAPRYLRETLIFPYVEGLRFIVHERRKRPWTTVDAIYRRPPESTEQILHPEKYDNKEKPVSVREGALAALKDWKRIRGETLGEFQMRLWLETRVEAALAKQASEGWGGDRLVAFESPDGSRVAVVLMAAWDSEADAQEFQRAVSRLLARIAGQPEAKGERATYVADSETFASEQRGKLVVVGIGIPEVNRDAIMEGAWKAFRVGR